MPASAGSRFDSPPRRVEAASAEEGQLTGGITYEGEAGIDRLLLLRELAAGDRRLTELAQALGLSKSTLHGHLAVLRSAGLIRLSLGAEKDYGLRPGLPDLNRILADYLGRG